MSEHASSSKIMERLIAGICLALAFLVLASVFTPDQSHADEHDDAAHSDAQHHDADHHADDHAHQGHDHGASLGTIESGAYRLEIFAGEHGPFYTVIDIETEKVLGEHMTAEEISSRFSDLEVPSMNIEDATGPLMMADDDEHFSW